MHVEIDGHVVHDVAPPAESPIGSALAQAALRLAERWSEAARAQAIYPAGHHRVSASLEVLAQTLAALHALANGTPVQIVFTGRGVLRSGMDMFLVGLGVAVVGYVLGDWIVRVL